MLNQLIVTCAASGTRRPMAARQIALAKPPQFHIKNTIHLKGFAGKNAHSKSAATGNPIVVFSLATKSRVKDRQSGEWTSHTEWHSIVCFGDVARAAQGLEKGDYVEVEGELRSSEYHAPAADGNAQGSSPRRSWEVRAAHVRKLERRAQAGSQPSTALPTDAA